MQRSLRLIDFSLSRFALCIFKPRYYVHTKLQFFSLPVETIFIISKHFSLFWAILFVLKSIFPYSNVYARFLCLLFEWCIFLLKKYFPFDLPFYLYLKYISCRDHKRGAQFSNTLVEPLRVTQVATLNPRLSFIKLTLVTVSWSNTVFLPSCPKPLGSFLIYVARDFSFYNWQLWTHSPCCLLVSLTSKWLLGDLMGLESGHSSKSN